MNHAESFVFPGTRSPKNWSPVRASLQASLSDLLPRTRTHPIVWDRVLGAVLLLGVSMLAWTSVGVTVARWWK